MDLKTRQAAALERPGIPIDDAQAYVEIARFGATFRTVLFIDKERGTFDGAPSWYSSVGAIGQRPTATKGLYERGALNLSQLRAEVRRILKNLARELLVNVGVGEIVIAYGEAGIHARRRLSAEELETLPREWLELPPAGD